MASDQLIDNDRADGLKGEKVDYNQTPAILQQRVVDHKGCPIHYWDSMQEELPVIVCMHGALMDHRMFNAQVPVLHSKYRIVTWDARGHGLSQPVGLENPTIDDYTEDLLELLNDAGINQAILVGQSMGAYIAQHLIRRYPERAAALVVIGSTPIAFPINAMEYWALQYSGLVLGLWPWKSLKPYMARNTAKKDAVIRYAESAMDQVDRKTFLAIWKAVSSAVRREGFSECEIQVPFLLTHGEHDRSGTIRRDAPHWAASLPHCRYAVIPDASHNANQDNPVYFNQILMDFLENLPLQAIDRK
jgi:3-oxoadipate enol-lactonase